MGLLNGSVISIKTVASLEGGSLGLSYSVLISSPLYKTCPTADNQASRTFFLEIKKTLAIFEQFEKLFINIDRDIYNLQY